MVLVLVLRIGLVYITGTKYLAADDTMKRKRDEEWLRATYSTEKSVKDAKVADKNEASQKW